MKLPHLRFAAIGIFGLLAPFWWSFAVSQLGLGLYVLAGSPEAPSPLALWSSILIPACAVGLGAGVVVAVLSQYRPISGWLIFLGSLIIGSAAFAQSVTSLVELAASPGNWAFVISALLGALAATGANNSFKPKLLRNSA